jgi:hypothetical protein
LFTFTGFKMYRYIGLSLSRCLLDIYEGRYNPDEVLVITTRTKIEEPTSKIWEEIWFYYYHGTSLGHTEVWGHLDDDKDKEGMYRLFRRLYASGKIHQPRNFGAAVGHASIAHPWVSLDTTDALREKNPTLKKMWNKYQTLALLTKD